MLTKLKLYATWLAFIMGAVLTVGTMCAMAYITDSGIYSPELADKVTATLVASFALTILAGAKASEL